MILILGHSNYLEPSLEVKSHHKSVRLNTNQGNITMERLLHHTLPGKTFSLLADDFIFIFKLLHF
jgi:hypothetical protein